MNARAASAPHRARLLRALGVVPWRQRAVAMVPNAVNAVSAGISANARCVIVVPPGCLARELDLLGRALCTFGPSLARAARIETSGENLAQIPHVKAYLAFGEAQAHALGRALPAEVMRDAHIVLADVPADVLAQPASKRRLWQALRTMRRALAANG